MWELAAESVQICFKAKQVAVFTVERWREGDRKKERG